MNAFGGGIARGALELDRTGRDLDGEAPVRLQDRRVSGPATEGQALESLSVRMCCLKPVVDSEFSR